MRTMYDSVDAGHLPADAAMVGGYLNGPYAWSISEWLLFPTATKVAITVRDSLFDGHVLDVENGANMPTPASAVGWVAEMRQRGADPTVYCNASTWPMVRAAFQNAGVPEPWYWLAKYDGRPDWDASWAPNRVVAKQYLGDQAPGWDKSSVADYWPGVDPRPESNTEDDEMQVDFPAADDGHKNVYVKGKTQMWFCVDDLGGYTPVQLTSIDFYGPTPAGSGAAGVGGAIRAAHVDAHRPGPFLVPPGAVQAQVRYTATAAFAVGLS